MKEKEIIRSERVKREISMPEPDGKERSAKYNYLDMKAETVMAKEGFPKRLAELRLKKGISGREMSLTLGQGAGYINNIENGYNLPSMAMFFEICEVLDVSPEEFFVYTASDTETSLVEMILELSSDEKDLLLKLITKFRRETK